MTTSPTIPPRSSKTRRVINGIALLVTGIYAVAGPWIHPSVAVTGLLRVDILLLTSLGLVALVFPGSGRGRSLPPLVAGGLAGAVIVAPWVTLPWLALPAFALAWSWRSSGPRKRRWSYGATALLVGVANCSLVAGLSARGFRVAPESFAAMDFPVNRLLADIPIHDVWAIDLKGDSSPTMADLVSTFRRTSPFHSTPAVSGLVLLRGAAGLVLGWEDPRWASEDASFVHRLTDNVRHRSTIEPGTALGIWRLVYALPREGVVETINGTVHVAVAGSIQEEPEGTRLFLSFRVGEVNWTTAFYMRLIDPSRRFFVYPSLLGQLAHAWEREAERSH